MSKSNFKKMKGALSELLERSHREYRNPQTTSVRQFQIIRDTIILSYKMINKFEDLSPQECRDMLKWYHAFTKRFSTVQINGDHWALGHNWWIEALAQTSTIDPKDMKVLYNGVGWNYETSVKPIFDSRSTIEPFPFIRDEVEDGKVVQKTSILNLHMISAGEFPVGSYWFHKRGTLYQLILNEGGKSLFEGCNCAGPEYSHDKVRQLMIPADGALVRSSRGKIDWKVTDVTDWKVQLKPTKKGVDPITRYAMTIDRLWNPVTK